MKKLLLLATLLSILQCNNKTNGTSFSETDSLDAITDSVAFLNNAQPIKKSFDSVKVKDLKKYFTEKKDEFESYSWVKPKSRPIYINQNGFYCYFQKNEDGTVSNLRFVGQYAADDWLFIRNIKFNIDGKTFNYVPNEMKTDHDSTIWEWFDDGSDVYNSEILEALRTAKSAKVRFNGDQYYKDKKISSENLKSIQRTLDYYKALGGTY
ncbi:hypothetical protein [Epilithonimonas hominis]|uniref:hypothetical protein n=1 Tax=Epilithonimonas hominis TaxID=420404 RepID=UPI00289E9642|nr:hypothetical protein [Epilithonimonas hominis]